MKWTWRKNNLKYQKLDWEQEQLASSSGHQHMTLCSSVVTSMNELLRGWPQKVCNNSSRQLPYSFQGQWVLFSAGLWCTDGDLVVLLTTLPHCLLIFLFLHPPYLVYNSVRWINSISLKGQIISLPWESSVLVRAVHYLREYIKWKCLCINLVLQKCKTEQLGSLLWQIMKRQHHTDKKIWWIVKRFRFHSRVCL